jgi:hypothetical protein
MQASLWHTSWWIPSANNSLGCCWNHCTTVALMSLSCFCSSLVLFWRAKHMEIKFGGCMEGGLTPSTTPCTVCSGDAGQMQSGLDGFCTCKSGIEPCHTAPVYCNSPWTGHFWLMVCHAHSHMIKCNLLYLPVVSQMRYIWTSHIEDSSLLGF